jgi:hypothetical protein
MEETRSEMIARLEQEVREIEPDAFVWSDPGPVLLERALNELVVAIGTRWKISRSSTCIWASRSASTPRPTLSTPAPRSCGTRSSARRKKSCTTIYIRARWRSMTDSDGVTRSRDSGPDFLIQARVSFPGVEPMLCRRPPA